MRPGTQRGLKKYLLNEQFQLETINSQTHPTYSLSSSFLYPTEIYCIVTLTSSTLCPMHR